MTTPRINYDILKSLGFFCGSLSILSVLLKGCQSFCIDCMLFNPNTVVREMHIFKCMGFLLFCCLFVL